MEILLLCSYVAPLPNCTCPTPSFLQIFPRRSHYRTKSNPLSLLKYQTHSKNLCSLTFLPTSYCADQENYQSSSSTSYSYHSLFEQSGSSIDSKFITNQKSEAQNQEQEEKQIKKLKRHFTNMWWVNLKAALGQRINIEGIVSSVSVFVKEQHLALPHASVRDMRFIDWAELHRRGFKGVVFDKDNTITVPYSLTLWGPLVSSIEQCKSVFGNDLAVFSNSAGLYEYDHDGSKARALEKAIGIKVIRHKVKKPAGTAEEIEKHFGCKSSQLIMVGDRPFTDVVYGNRNGFLTILTEPLSLAEEPFIVRQVRKLELSLTNHWFRRGMKPISHGLLPDASRSVRDVPPL